MLFLLHLYRTRSKNTLDNLAQLKARKRKLLRLALLRKRRRALSLQQEALANSRNYTPTSSKPEIKYNILDSKEMLCTMQRRNKFIS